MKKNIKKNEKGITLVALVVTIVVLLILAGISLNLVLGQNGIVNKAKEAKEKTTKDQENIQIALNTLYDEMTGLINEDKNPVNPGGNRPELTGDNWDEVLEYANAHPEEYKYPGQEKLDIGIGTDGEPVNMDLWTYSNVDSMSYRLSKLNPLNSSYTPGYENANIQEGRIQGKVLAYIRSENDSQFYPVTDMSYTFLSCSSLVVTPEIPSRVTNMQGTFRDCSSLIIAPKIPSSVTNMYDTFSGCIVLSMAQEIPSSVTNMGGTFYNCSALTGNIVINANPSNYSQCFENVATNEGTNLIVSGTSSVLDEIIATKSANSNINKSRN